jgi:hypothetical protein
MCGISENIKTKNKNKTKKQKTTKSVGVKILRGFIPRKIDH